MHDVCIHRRQDIVEDAESRIRPQLSELEIWVLLQLPQKFGGHGQHLASKVLVQNVQGIVHQTQVSSDRDEFRDVEITGLFQFTTQNDGARVSSGHLEEGRDRFSSRSFFCG